MNHQIVKPKNHKEISALFSYVFTDSEGEEEGKLIGNLALELSSNIDNEEIICIGTYDNDSLIAVIFFTRLRFKSDKSPLIYMLAPVAVSSAHQGKGIGQALINYGLADLKKRSADIAITYGDPAFYCKVGFEPLAKIVIKAPLPLSMPIGWLGQSLTDEAISAISERPSCVQAFNNPVYW